MTVARASMRERAKRRAVTGGGRPLGRPADAAERPSGLVFCAGLVVAVAAVAARRASEGNAAYLIVIEADVGEARYVAQDVGPGTSAELYPDLRVHLARNIALETACLDGAGAVARV
jgi:hypothetical protein